jgi:hypothetical protein
MNMTTIDTEDETPTSCECDNGHEQAETVCRYCWSRGWRSPKDRWPLDLESLEAAIGFLSDRLDTADTDAFERLDMLANAIRRQGAP